MTSLTSINGRSLRGMGLTREREVVLCWGLTEQARHGHMLDEYKNQYTIDVTPSPSWTKVRDTTTGSQRTKPRGVVKQTNTGLSNTYHMTKLRKLSWHAIGQNGLLIDPHFGIEPIQPPRLLNSDGSENVTLDRFVSSLLNIIQTSHGQCTSNKKCIISKPTLSISISRRCLRHFIFAHRFKMYTGNLRILMTSYGSYF